MKSPHKFINRSALFGVFAAASVGLAATGAQTVPASSPAPSAQANAPATSLVEVKLAENGQALLPIVISAQASEREKALARTLADYLKRISGGEFKIETATAPLNKNASGIVLGTTARFAPAFNELKLKSAADSEDYILRSHRAGVLLIGASEQAVEHAVWDLLHRLGYRQYFPGASWEIVPTEKNLRLAVNALESPDYNSRRIWPGWGVLPENRDDLTAWYARNRMAEGITIHSGHAYQNIVNRHKAEFEAHPEYFTKPGSGKFCVSNQGLQQLVIADALAQFERNPQLQSISLEPSDGGGWETDGACSDGELYHSVTDRAVFLANLVAEAVSKKYPDKFIGLYAYNEHSPPPTIAVHPNVVISIATSFIRGNYTLDQLFAGWSAKASRLGVREYYSVNTWDRDLPGSARGSDLAYLQQTIPAFHAQKARFLSAEASDNWGPNGLGYYFASRLLWNTDEASRREEIKTEFLQKAFGAAREPMAEFYRLLDGANKPLLSNDLVGRMYRQLDKAFESTPDPDIRKRLHDLALYTRYVELYAEYSQAVGAARQSAFENLLRFAWRIRGTHMIHAYALWRDLPARDKKVSLPEAADWKIPEPQNPWKSSTPFSLAEIQKFIADGIVKNELLNFETVAFSRDLVPATPLNLKSTKLGGFVIMRGDLDFYTWVSQTPSVVELQVGGGMIYTNRGDAKIELFPAAEAEMKSVAQAVVPADKQKHDVQLATNLPGLHRINVSDNVAGTSLNWREALPMTVESSLANRTKFESGRWSMYFYVPKGTKVVGGYRNAGAGEILDGNGQSVLKFTTEKNPGYWSVPVAQGQDGKAWMLSTVSGQVMLMTVPPYLARSAAEMLLPREVVEADALK
jgi:hypothetical protein